MIAVTNMTMTCFCGGVERRQTLSLISSRDNCQKFPPWQTFDTSRKEFESVQSLVSSLVERNFAEVTTTAPLN